MPRSRFPHRLIPPPEPFPTWRGTGSGPLVYLAWGDRDYRRFPIPIHSNPGWTYWFLARGQARVETADARAEFTAPGGFLAGPDCAFGFPRQPAAGARVGVWIWRDAPRCLDDPDAAALLPVVFGGEQLELLNDLHAQTRLEIFQNRPHHAAALEHIRGLIEIQFARALAANLSGENEILAQRARRWMVEHLTEPALMSDLAHYLGVSTARLHRLFRTEMNVTPGAYFHDLKLRHCARMLEQPGASVKRVAYENGYRHANDFSRAFKKHFGYPPSRVRQAFHRPES